MDFAMMVAAWQRRMDWLAERQAVHTINLLGQALGGKKGKPGRNGSGPPKKVSAGQMMKQAGAEIR